MCLLIDMSLGLSLSGGGSRAAAFHRGTVKALEELGLVDKLSVVSTISGGSVFGAAWMASRKRGEETGLFLEEMGRELGKGFIGRSIRPRAAKMLVPGLTRTNVLADTFDSVFFKGMKLGDIPDSPRLCMNVSVLNNGHLGKFTKGEFKCAGITPPEHPRSYSEPVKMEEYPLSLAATASAAYPGLLAPIYLKRGKGGIPKGWGRDGLKDHSRFALVDGGVLDNLGVQSLLSSKSGLSCWDIIVSDAGTREELWKPRNIVVKAFKSAWDTACAGVGVGIGWISIGDLLRVNKVMFNKEVRQMRHHLFDEQEKSWMMTAIDSGKADGALKEFVGRGRGSHGARERRKILFIKINQFWDSMIGHIPNWRLWELAARAGVKVGRYPDRGNTGEMEQFLAECGVDLAPAKDIFKRMGGDEAVRKANDVATGFSKLPGESIDILYSHALWQAKALYGIYWK
ncbi:MAG TPA: patatin-like phospholipase family protein [Acidobacteriota bacterium]|nr:patatin-like phospholipase family protein [Acidobacteriota bacterium]HQQ45862.1 patatin-like phospholipase family protein [Acidobacteriota bacterium]